MSVLPCVRGHPGTFLNIQRDILISYKFTSKLHQLTLRGVLSKVPLKGRGK